MLKKTALLLSLVTVMQIHSAFADNFKKMENSIKSTIESLQLRRHSIETSYNDDGEVTVSGYVATQEDKDSVLTKIQAIPGVTKVENTLTVKDSEATSHAANGDIEPTLSANELVRKHALLSIKKLNDLKSYEVDVEVTDAKIIVSGNASSEDTIKITKVVRSVADGRLVSNQMTLRPLPSDDEVVTRIRRALSEEKDLDWDGITISVDQGVATLSGAKPNHRIIDRILSITNMVDGVNRVESKLKVIK